MKFKRIIAVTVAAMCIVNTTAFAATAAKAEEVQVVKVYSYDEVLEKAKKNNSDLSLLKEQLDLLDKQSTNTAQGLGGLIYPSNSSSYVTNENYTALAQLNSYMVQMKTSKYTKEALEKKLEYSVKTILSEIVTNEEALKLSEEELDVYNEKFNKANLQYKLGMISESEKTQAKNDLVAYQAEIETTKQGIENSYKSLSRLMGLSDTDFQVSYGVEYKKFELIMPLETYIARKNQTNPTLIGAKLGLESLKNSKNFTLANSTSPYGYDSIMLQIAQTEASVKSAEDGYKAMTEGTYKSILTIENNIKALEDSLPTLEKNLTVVETNFAAGKATALEVKEAKLNLQKVENSIESLKISYMNTVYVLENPCAASAAS